MRVEMTTRRHSWSRLRRCASAGSIMVGARTETLAVETIGLGLVRTTDATVADSFVLMLAGDEDTGGPMSRRDLCGRMPKGEVKALLDWRERHSHRRCDRGVLFLLNKICCGQFRGAGLEIHMRGGGAAMGQPSEEPGYLTLGADLRTC